MHACRKCIFEPGFVPIFSRIVRASMRIRVVHPGNDDTFDNFMVKVKEALNSEGEASPVFGKVDSMHNDGDRHILQITCHPR